MTTSLDSPSRSRSGRRRQSRHRRRWLSVSPGGIFLSDGSTRRLGRAPLSCRDRLGLPRRRQRCLRAGDGAAQPARSRRVCSVGVRRACDSALRRSRVARRCCCLFARLVGRGRRRPPTGRVDRRLAARRRRRAHLRGPRHRRGRPGAPLATAQAFAPANRDEADLRGDRRRPRSCPFSDRHAAERPLPTGPGGSCTCRAWGRLGVALGGDVSGHQGPAGRKRGRHRSMRGVLLAHARGRGRPDDRRREHAEQLSDRAARSQEDRESECRRSRPGGHARERVHASRCRLRPVPLHLASLRPHSRAEPGDRDACGHLAAHAEGDGLRHRRGRDDSRLPPPRDDPGRTLLADDLSRRHLRRRRGSSTSASTERSIPPGGRASATSSP